MKEFKVPQDQYFRLYPEFKADWNVCHRGDWMLWVASELRVDMRKLIIAKTLCANTVRHLIPDDIKPALDTAIAFGNGSSGIDEFNTAEETVYSALKRAHRIRETSSSCVDYPVYMAVFACYCAVSDSSLVSHHDSGAAHHSAMAIWYNAMLTCKNADLAKIKNQKQTADICRSVLSEVVFDEVNNICRRIIC